MTEGTSVWIGNGHRTAAGHKLVLLVNDGLKTHGWARNDRKAVKRVIGELYDNDPAYGSWALETLRSAYYRAEPLPPPLATEEDRWMSLLIQWGKETKRHPALISAEQAREIVNRLIAVAPHRRADLDQLFVHMDRRIHWNGKQKIKWLRTAIDRMAANPHDWPIPISRRGRPDVTAGRIETYLANAPGKRAHKRDIVAALRIPTTTAQTTLCSMERAKRIVREANGVYAPWTEGAAYVATDKAILEVLANGPAGPAELRARTGKSDAAIHGGLHRLKKKGTIVLTQRGKYAMYALAGTAPLHVYAGDAIDQALESGSKTLPELETVTEKKRSELWAALLRKVAKGEVVKAYLINVGHRGRLAAFAAAPAHR